MPDVMQEFVRETIDLMLKELPVEKRLEGISDQDRLKGMPPEKRLDGLSKEEMLQLQEELARRLQNNETSA